MDRLTPARVDDDDRLRFPPVPPPQSSGTEKKESEDPPPQPSMPAIRQAILDLFAQPPPRPCPHCEKIIAERFNQNLPK